MVKNTPSHLSLCHAWPTCRRQANWLSRTSGSISTGRLLSPPRSLVPLLSRDSPGDCIAAPLPRLIPMSPIGLRHRDATQSIDQATVVPPVREICSIASLSSASPLSLTLGTPAMATSSLPSVARPRPRWRLGLVSLRLHRRVVGVFL
jgi:hypothetical protein